VATYKLTLEYCGTEFAGWALQPDRRTVEAVVTDALESVLAEKVKLRVAGRTDTGVHALGQVVSFSSAGEPEAERLRHSLNGLLPSDVSALAAERVPDDFDARGDARSRTYCYRLLARRAPSPIERDRALWWPRELDRAALDACAAAIVGKHDFTAFTQTRSDHNRFERRVTSAQWLESGELLEFWIEGETFMRHMVRALIGTMLDVAIGRMTVPDFAALLSGAPRATAGATAQPHGLYLVSVAY